MILFSILLYILTLNILESGIQFFLNKLLARDPLCISSLFLDFFDKYCSYDYCIAE